MTLSDTRPAADEAGESWAKTRLGPAPTKYTPGVHKQICQNIEAGNRPVTAAQMAGITSSTYYGWMKLGKEGNPHLVQFVDDIEIALGVAESKAVKIIQDAAWENPENAKWWLERQRAAAFSKEVEAKVVAQQAEFMDRLEAGLPPDIFTMVCNVASGAGLQAQRGYFQLTPAPKDDADSSSS